MRLCSSARADGGGSGFLPLGWSAKKNNSKRSTILQHLLAGPHQQMLQNSSALEIKKRQVVAVRQAMQGWELGERMAALEASCSPRLSANGNSERER